MPESSKLVDQEVQVDRRWKDRRVEDGVDLTGDEEATAEFQPPRRKKQRRRQIDPTTCERDYNNEEIRFMQALDDYKRCSGRMFPTCSEILEVVRGLGYVKLSEEEQQLLESIESVEAELEELDAVLGESPDSSDSPVSLDNTGEEDVERDSLS